MINYITYYKNGEDITEVEIFGLTLSLHDSGGAYCDIYANKQGLDRFPIHTLNGWNYEKNQRDESTEQIRAEFLEWVEEESFLYLENMAPQFLR